MSFLEAGVGGWIWAGIGQTGEGSQVSVSGKKMGKKPPSFTGVLEVPPVMRTDESCRKARSCGLSDGLQLSSSVRNDWNVASSKEGSRSVCSFVR